MPSHEPQATMTQPADPTPPDTPAGNGDGDDAPGHRDTAPDLPQPTSPTEDDDRHAAPAPDAQNQRGADGSGAAGAAPRRDRGRGGSLR